MQRLTLTQKILLTLGLIVAVLLAILGGIIYPVARKIYRLQKEINQVEAELEKRYENSQKLKRTIKEMDGITKNTNQLSQAMIAAGGELSMITELENLAEKNHITQNLEVAFKEIKAEAPRAAEASGEGAPRAGLTHFYLLNFSNQGEFADHVRYLAALEKMPFYLITDSIKWEKSKEDKTGKSTISLNFSGIIYVDPTSIKK
ncbi:MAG: hypothetical protein HY569_02725 [Candidatus Magasanikbacteria bacterium]|nr:hypothetical protein [Candidatus Magasanikbacteria bacterium]